MARPDPGAAARGALQWEYRPPGSHPILYAGVLAFGAVLAMGSVENALRGGRSVLYAVYALPLVAVLWLMAALWPSPVRIHAHGIAPARPLALRWHRPFLPWDDMVAAFPAYYDVTGAFVSPFASSDGKVTQMGLRVEMADGHAETLRFTPTRFEAGQARSAGFEGALEAVRRAFAARGRPLVPPGDPVPPETQRRLLDEATRPFAPFLVIILLFAGAAPVLLLLVWLGAPVPVALAAAVALPLGTSLHSLRASRRRNRILNGLARSAEAARP